MNNNNLDKFIQNIESIKMTNDEKNTMRDSLYEFSHAYSFVPSPYSNALTIMRKGFAIAFIAVISIGSLSSLASGDALPGDTLYPVKIVHEEIKLAATFDTKKKISYEIKLTEKRIREATELATEYDLDDEKQADIADSIAKQTFKVKEHINEVKKQDPEQALVLNAELKSTIEVNSDALRQVSTSKQKRKKQVSLDLISEEQKTEIANNSDALDKTQMRTAQVVETADADPEQTSLSTMQDLSEEFEDVDVSFAEKLLEKINAEVLEIDAFDERVTEEINQSEVRTEEENLDIPALEETSVDLNLETESSAEEKENDISNTQEIETEIKSLEDIVDIKKDIEMLKKKISESTSESSLEELYKQENEIRKQVDILVADKKYKKSFIMLAELLQEYSQILITADTEKDLGIDIKSQPKNLLPILNNNQEE